MKKPHKSLGAIKIPIPDKNLFVGKNIPMIAKEFGVDYSTSKKWFNHYNITPTRQKRTPINKKQIPPKEELEYLYTKYSVSDIRRHYGDVSDPTIKKWLVYHNIPIKLHSDTIKKHAIPKIKQTNIERYGSEMFPIPNISKTENEIREWFGSLGIEMQSTRKVLQGKELDGYNDTKKIAFEYCGHYWHSDHTNTDKNQHWNKWSECQAKGIRLFTIFEGEWKTRTSQIKGFIKGSLGIFDKTIYARQCSIVTNYKMSNIVRKFINDNHIQKCPRIYEYSIELWYENALVGVILISKHHRQGKKTKTLSRLCIKNGLNIIGGSKRMFSYITEDIVTWSDNKYSNGDLYARLGMNLDCVYKPDYFYVKSNGEYRPKQAMTKKKIGAGSFDTEYEKAKSLGWYRIWDCGKKKWSYKYSHSGEINDHTTYTSTIK